ncbi:MAG: ABC transporter permease [Gammaproteobacteria bacterium]|nr:MAG: ABC transporter permease [Gammaproteobacteria bacterium]
MLLKRLLKYRDLLLVFIWREFLIRYRQSFIGVLWAILQPLSMMLLFVFVFGVILQMKGKGYPYPLFFFAGILPWTFFAGSTNHAVNCLVAHFNLITKIYFPREIIPLSGVAINFIDYLIGFAVYLVLIMIYGTPVTWNFLWVIPLVIILVVFTTSFGYLLAALNVYYRDVKLASNFIIQFLFFATPVIYSIDQVQTRWKLILFLNPLTFIVENMRRVTIEGRSVVWWQFLVEAILVGVFYWLVCKIFIRIERAFADVI